MLDYRGFRCVNWDCYDPDFEFVAGEDKVCRLHSVIAEFLSPKVGRLRRCDISFSSFTFKDPELFNVFEGLVSSLSVGESFLVDESNFVKLICLAQELENCELLYSLLKMINAESLTPKEAVVLLQTENYLGTGTSAHLINFVASRFYGLDEEILEDLDLDMARLLLSSPSLRIENEDSLCDWIRSRAEKDLNFTTLFEFVYFRFLSESCVENFASFVRLYLVEDVHSRIWAQVSRRLTDVLYPCQRNPHKCLWTHCEFHGDWSNPFDGIIAYLTSEHGGNVHDKGIVNITASSIYENNSAYHPKNVADLGTNSSYESDGDQDAWICYDFKDRLVIPERYSLRSKDDERGGHHLKSWVIEVSNDGVSWTVIDRQNDNQNLNGKYAQAIFLLFKIPNEAYRFFRLRQTGRNHHDARAWYYVELTSLEIYGKLFEK